MESTIKFYDELIASIPEIERKGKTMPYTSLNGHIYSFLSKEGIMGMRLSDLDKDEIISNYKSQLMVQQGRTIKDFVEIPEELLEDVNRLKIYLQKSYNFTLSLKPK